MLCAPHTSDPKRGGGPRVGNDSEIADSVDGHAYWSERLASDWDLRGTGHRDYSATYNAWMYRAKRRALRRALEGVDAQRALDVGAGTGWATRELLRLGGAVDACDITEVAVTALRRDLGGDEETFFVLDIGTQRIPRPDRSYGLVTALDVLYHVKSDSAFEAAVAELGRVLEPSGRLIVTDALSGRSSDPAPHVRFRSAAFWDRVASSNDLRLVHSLPLYRWLSRPRQKGAMSRLPDALRGPIEFSLERLVPRTPHMHLAVFERLNPVSGPPR